MSDLAQVRAARRRVGLALGVVTLLVMAAHAAVEYAVSPDLDPLIFAIDAGTAVILVAVFLLYVARLAQERQREVVEHMLLDILAVPRNIEATASEVLKALRAERLGDAALVAIVGDGEHPLRPVATSGYPRGWSEQAPLLPLAEVPSSPAASRPRTPSGWVSPVASTIAKRPWVVQVPLRSGSDLLGLLLIVAKQPGPLRDPGILDLLATRLGAAFDHAALYEAAYARERDLEDLELRRREFMAAIAHEIRTPLTSIQAFADLLQMGKQEMDETASSLVSSLGQGVQRLSGLVNDLIDLGRTGESAYPVEPRNVDLGEVIRSAEATLRPALMLRDHAVTLDLPETGPVALADPRVLEQVTLNLLSNANRHSPAGGSIRISARQLDTTTVRIEVADDGPGIPESERERIFQPYYRIRREHGPEVPGSGLGLAVARQLLDGSGGRIWADAGEGGGARFCVEVRAAPSDALR